MEPKEKAEELVDKFTKYAYCLQTENDELFVSELNKNAKQCALIAVDEILNTNDIDSEYSYYLAVKNEINKLWI